MSLAIESKFSAVTDHERDLVIVGARLSNVKLNEVERRTGKPYRLIQRMVEQYGNEAEKLRQQMRADASVMRHYSFDKMYPPNQGDTSVDKAMRLQGLPTFPKRRTKRRLRPVRARRSEPKVMSIAEPMESAAPELVQPRAEPVQHQADALEQSALACATYVLERLRK